MIQQMNTTTIPDRTGKMAVIQVGDEVDLLPSHPDFPDGKMNQYLPEGGREFILKQLGKPGPYKICRIIKDERAVCVYLHIDGKEIPIRRYYLVLD